MKDDLHIFENFTVTCNKCGGKNIEMEDSRGYSEISGAWGSLDLICRDCEQSEEIAGT